MILPFSLNCVCATGLELVCCCLDDMDAFEDKAEETATEAIACDGISEAGGEKEEDGKEDETREEAEELEETEEIHPLSKRGDNKQNTKKRTKFCFMEIHVLDFGILKEYIIKLYCISNRKSMINIFQSHCEQSLFQSVQKLFNLPPTFKNFHLAGILLNDILVMQSVLLGPTFP